MAKFMNAELERIRDNLVCGHCSAIFTGSDSQAWHVKYEKSTVYCSPACRSASARARLIKPIPNRGPCKHCGEVFFSRKAKLFCSMDCYTKSNQFLKMLRNNSKKQRQHRLQLSPEIRAKIAATQRTGEFIQCLECGEETYSKKSRPRKFCSQTCYRSYMAKRFDRWIANPEGVALPQCYDEFLDREVLGCVVGNCRWKGKHLSLHINLAHGLKAQDFKRSAGFNLGTGLVSKDTSKLMSERSVVGAALGEHDRIAALAKSIETQRNTIRYRSLEAVEHYKKAIALGRGPGPVFKCKSCGVESQRISSGRALYCSSTCRDAYYKEQNRVKNKQPRLRNPDGTFQ